MDGNNLLQRFDQEMRIQMEYPDMRKESLPGLVRFTRAAPGVNFVLYSQLNEKNVDRVIEEQVAYFSQFDQPFEWKVYEHDQPADMAVHLKAHGFEVDEPYAVMTLDLQDVPAPLLEPVKADIRQITDHAGLADVVHILEEVWGGSFQWVHQRMGAYLDIPGYLSLYVGYIDNHPVTTGWTFFYPNNTFGSLWGGSTLEPYRRRGLYSALLAVRVQEAIRRGTQNLVIEAGSMSRPIIAKHGFRLLTYVRDCTYKKSTPIS